VAKGQRTIKSEISKLVRKRVEPSYLEKLGVLSCGKKNVDVLHAIALAQVKKGLEGDLKSAMYIEQLLSDECEDADSGFDIVVKVVGEGDGA